jgi:hypothetical protein
MLIISTVPAQYLQRGSTDQVKGSWRDAGEQGAEVLEQTLPGDEKEISEEDADRRTLPDGCISDGLGWALLIDSKFAAKVSADQLRRHLRTAARNGLETCKLLLLTVCDVKRAAAD